MKLPVRTLRSLVTTSLDADALGDLLTMAGFEVEEVIGAGDDAALDLKVMSNRGDGLSALGMAREVLAKAPDAEPTELYRYLTLETFMVGGESGLAEVRSPDCLRFVGAIIEDVENLEAPAWVREALEAAGMRSISLLVDLTNYVMLELGQPLHAFDLDRLRGGRIVVRLAEPGETITTLDGREHVLRPDMTMICDAERPVAVAGVMGGAETEVGPGTRRVFLEAAAFRNTSIRRTRKALGLNTEASYRFERHVDPAGVARGAARFLELLREAGTGRVAASQDLYPSPAPVRTIPIRLTRCARLLGLEVEEGTAVAALRALGFEVSEPVTIGDQPFGAEFGKALGEMAREGFREVTVPGWRPDVKREEDVAEEIGRVVGYDRIPERLPEGSTTPGGVRGPFRRAAVAREALLRNGYDQAISHSLRDAHPLDALGERVGPRNPASPTQALLRNSLLPGLIEAAVRNGGRDVRLFETGRVFSPGVERYSIAALATGRLVPSDRKGEAVPEADFAAIRGALDAVVLALGLAVSVRVPEKADGRFHPMRQGEVLLGGSVVGWLGEVHPDLTGLPEAVYAFEMDLDVLTDTPGELRVSPVSRHPSVRRDLAVLVSKSVPYAVLESAVTEAAGAQLERQWLFDVYEGAGVPEGSVSLGIALRLRKAEGTFTDEEANRVRDAVAAALSARGATLR